MGFSWTIEHDGKFRDVQTRIRLHGGCHTAAGADGSSTVTNVAQFAQELTGVDDRNDNDMYGHVNNSVYSFLWVSH